MIREAKPEEAIIVARFMKRFEECTEHVKVDPAYAGKRYEEFIRQGRGAMLMLLDDSTGEMVGGLGCLKCPDIHFPQMIAVETFWFVAPEHRGQGVRLLEAFELWAKRNGCDKVAMIHLEDSYPETLRKLYLRRDYKLVESHYVREV